MIHDNQPGEGEEMKNLISGGHCDPFVYSDSAGIHVGDCDNHEVFTNRADAIAFARRARLSGDNLKRAKRAHDHDHRDNWAAEYGWHVDAGLQIDAIKSLGE